MYALLWLLLALAPTLVAPQNVNNAACQQSVRPLDTFCSGAVGQVGGVLAVSTYSSCAFTRDTQTNDPLLDCGDSQMTVLDISLQPGVGGTISYNFVVANQAPAGGSASTAEPGPNGGCSGGGNCVTTRAVRLEITTSDFLTFYKLAPTSYTEAYQSVAFHSNDFDVDPTPGAQCQPQDTNGKQVTYERLQKGAANPDMSRKYKEGAQFSGINTPGIEPGNLFTPKAWKLKEAVQIMGGSCRQPASDNGNFNGLDTNGLNCRVDENGNQCSAINPQPNAPNYGLQPKQFPVNSVLQNFGYAMPFSPYSTDEPFNISNTPINPYAIFADAFTYENSPDVRRRWISCLRKYGGGRLSNRSVTRQWAMTYFWRGLVTNSAYYYRWRSKEYFPPSYINNVIDDEDAFYIGDVDTVCIGCGYGQYFDSNDALLPLPAKNGGAWQRGDPWPFVNGMRRPMQQAVCSTDDDDCANAAMVPQSAQDGPTTAGTSATPYVPITVCRALIPPDEDTVYNLINPTTALLAVCAYGLNYFFDNTAETIVCSSDRQGIWLTHPWLMPDWLADTIGGFQALISYVFGGTLFGPPYTRDRHSTADTMGALGPDMCTVLEILPAAIPSYAVRAILYDAETNEVLQNITITNFPDLGLVPQGVAPDPTFLDQSTGQGGTDSQTVVGEGRQMYMRITGFETVTGSVGPDLEGYIKVCNTTNPATGIFQSARDPNFGTPTNPWVTDNNLACNGVSFGTRCGNVQTATDFCTAAGKVPLPQCLSPRARVPGEGYNPYAWWYYWPRRKQQYIGAGCGQLSADATIFNEKSTVQAVCNGPRYTCVPGYRPGYDWTRTLRLIDQITTSQSVQSVATGRIYRGPNSQERALRDDIRVHSPCVVSGYLREWSRATTCADFITLYEEQGYLPPNWVTHTGDPNTCSLPNYFVDGDRLYYSDASSSSGTQSALRIQVGVSGILTQVEATVSSGVFDLSVGQLPSCGVRFGESGQAQFPVRNTGTLIGQYQVVGRCTNGITVVPATKTIDAGQSDIIYVTVRQSGVTTGAGICTFNLTHPQYPQFTFDQINDVPCTLIRDGSGTSTFFGLANTTICNSTTNTACAPPLPSTPATSTKSRTLVSVITFIGALAFILLLAVLLGLMVAAIQA